MQSAQIIIWLMVGGAGTLLGPIARRSRDLLAQRRDRHASRLVNANVVLGAILLIFVLLVPKGIVPMVTERLVPRLLALRRPAVVIRAILRKEGKA